jgi:hypothetical protein
MRTAEDIESFLIQMDTPFDAVGNGIWRLKEIGPDLVISIADTVVVFRLKIVDLKRVPPEKREAFYRTLLAMNTAEILHGAYGLEEDAVVVTGALELENLDFNEFQATLDDIGLAMTNHYSMLSKFMA